MELIVNNLESLEQKILEIKNNKIKRIHQEDFSQALNIPSAYKYQAEGGASFADAKWHCTGLRTDRKR